jgi:hypothetical protein
VTVAIVLNPAYPDLEQLVGHMPIWAVDSAPHRAIAERLWQVRGADAFQGITLFKVPDEKDREGNCINVIGDVDLHHGVYSSGSKIETLRIIGATSSERLREELGAYGFVILEEMPDGFIARTQ